MSKFRPAPESSPYDIVFSQQWVQITHEAEAYVAFVWSYQNHGIVSPAEMLFRLRAITGKPGNLRKPMNTVNPSPIIPRQHETDIRVRYQETDAQGHVHHANYISYFEIGRVEMLRAGGISYREFEDTGLMLVVVDLKCEYVQPAKYDDLLRLRTSIIRAKGVRIRHQYEIFRSGERIAMGETTVACLNRAGKITPLPSWLRLD